MILLQATTIKVHADTKDQLNKFRENKSESYDEVIKKMVHILKSIERNPELSKQTMRDIENARERIKKGEFFSKAEVKKRLGL